jgi:hypothetical protein
MQTSYSLAQVLGTLWVPSNPIIQKVVKMSLIIFLLRNLVGGILVFFDLITRGTKLKR